MSIDILLDNDKVIQPNNDFIKKAKFSDPAIYDFTEKDRLSFWEDRANELHLR